MRKRAKLILLILLILSVGGSSDRGQINAIDPITWGTLKEEGGCKLILLILLILLPGGLLGEDGQIHAIDPITWGILKEEGGSRLILLILFILLTGGLLRVREINPIDPTDPIPCGTLKEGGKITTSNPIDPIWWLGTFLFVRGAVH